MVEDQSKVKQTGEEKHLTYKQVVLEGFSIFCDWNNVDLAENGGVDIKRLVEEQATLTDDTLDQSYFMQLIRGEFSDDKKRLIAHKYIIDNFQVQLRL